MNIWWFRCSNNFQLISLKCKRIWVIFFTFCKKIALNLLKNCCPILSKFGDKLSLLIWFLKLNQSHVGSELRPKSRIRDELFPQSFQFFTIILKFFFEEIVSLFAIFLDTISFFILFNNLHYFFWSKKDLLQNFSYLFHIVYNLNTFYYKQILFLIFLLFFPDFNQIFENLTLCIATEWQIVDLNTIIGRTIKIVVNFLVQISSKSLNHPQRNQPNKAK